MMLRQSHQRSLSEASCSTSYGAPGIQRAPARQPAAQARAVAGPPLQQHRRTAWRHVSPRPAYSDVASVETATLQGATHAGDGDASGSPPEAGLVREQLARLQQTVEQQARVMELQQAAIKELHRTIANSAASQPASLSPFQAQAFAGKDRRSQGLFDARYHSTSM
jgi:hypothetical protein